MTNNQHGQVPNKYLTVVYRDIAPGKEARELIEHPKMSASSWSHALNDRDAAIAQVSTLRTAHVQNPTEIEHDAGDVSKNGAGLNMSTQHARIAELEAQIEALSEVQALSAAPRTPTVEQVEDEVSMGHGAWDMVDPQELIGAVLRLSVAASPTPPAEQQVIIDFAQVGTAGPFHVVNGRVKLPDATMQDLARMLRPTYEAEQAVHASVKGAMWFTKKPVTIQAIQWTGDNLREVIAFTDGPPGPPDTRTTHAGMAWEAYTDLVARDGLKIYTLEGKMLASPGDWIIRGVKGEYYPCKDEIFRLTYAAASPTPTAEQQAQPGAVYAVLPAPTASIGTDDAWHEAAMRDFADRTHAARLRCKSEQARLATLWGYVRADATPKQAAPTAAPGELSADSLRHQNKLLAETLGACILASGIVRKDIDGFTGPELLHFGEDLRSMLEVAPKQEAQEPCPTCVALARTVMLDQVSFDRKPDCYGIRQITDDEGVEEWEDIRTSPDVAREEAKDMMATGRGEIYEVVPLWTTPQPAPAPLSEMPYEKRKAIQEGEQIGASDAWFHARHNMLDTLDRRNVFRAGFDRGWNAALDAQGGE